MMPFIPVPTILLLSNFTMAVDIPPHHSHCFNVARAHTTTTHTKNVKMLLGDK